MRGDDDYMLRLAAVAAVLAGVKTDGDGEIAEEHTAAILSALDYELRGDPGCIEPDEWQDRRERALREHGGYLGFNGGG